jgi:MoaA/NifB/PqqE/SkfB family radical SAM enzyme
MRSFQRYVEEAGQPLVRDRLDILQVNIGYVCNLACRHCHLEAGPHRTEAKSREVVTIACGSCGARGRSMWISPAGRRGE